MKDIDLGKEYVIPSPGYRNIRERNSLNQCGGQDGIKFRQEKYKVSSNDCFLKRIYPLAQGSWGSSFMLPQKQEPRGIGRAEKDQPKALKGMRIKANSFAGLNTVTTNHTVSDTST